MSSVSLAHQVLCIALKVHYRLRLRLWVVSPGHCWRWLPRIYHGEVTQPDSNHERSTASWGTADTFMAYDASSNHSARCTYLDLPERVAGEGHWLILGLILSKQSLYRVSLFWNLQNKILKESFYSAGRFWLLQVHWCLLCIAKVLMCVHYWRDLGYGFCLLGDCISVTGSVCLKPLASMSELNEYLFLPLLRSGSLSGLWEASESTFRRSLEVLQRWF